MLALLAMIKEKWGSAENCVIALGFLDAKGVESLRQNLIVDGAAINWRAHAELVTKAVEEADKLVDTIERQAGS